MTDVVMGLAVGALRNGADTLRIVAENVANSQTVGYQRQIPVMHAGFSELLSSGVATADPAQVVVATRVRAATDRRPGPLQRTGEVLNVALATPGYFAVETPEGVMLTRRGDWRLDADGRLVVAGGYPVLGQRGPIVATGPVNVASDGTVRLGDQVLDQLTVVVPAPEAQLEPRGDGLLQLPPDAPVLAGEPVSVRQGFLELTNVSPVQEMLQLIEASRHFEAVQRLVRGYDGLLDKAIAELGKVS